ncbi:hypothetical protein [Catelliglobosispora koreensis]|uniref:hypothetical protein n=1 Tax=Catelliglobosispora koreensis TaxID=129052 RepID=UPI00037E8E5D|nr:hypothetical protein [Catelliglobosispora koreensis]
MNEQKETWNELRDRLEALGLKLKLHREQAGDTGAKDALEKIGRSLEETFDAASKAINDEAVRADVKEAGRLVAEALSNTLRRIAGDVKAAVK